MTRFEKQMARLTAWRDGLLLLAFAWALMCVIGLLFAGAWLATAWPGLAAALLLEYEIGPMIDRREWW